jgi:hypothetical protein
MTVKELEQLEAIEYNHEVDSLPEAIGISDERRDMVMRLTLKVCAEESMKSRVVEIFLTNDDLTVAEKVFALTKLGQLWAMAGMAGLSGMLGSLGEE